MTNAWGTPTPLPDTSTLPSRVGAAAHGGMSPLASSGGPPVGGPGGGALRAQPMLSIFPWWLYEYPTAQDWNIASLNFTVAAGVVTPVPNFTLTTSPQNLGVIKYVQMSVQNSTPTMDVRLTLLINGAPVIGYTGVAFPPGTAGLIVSEFSGMIVRMPQGSTLTASFAETSGAPFICSLQALGWQVPLVDVDRLTGGLSY
jgi:hypothetical protein